MDEIDEYYYLQYAMIEERGKENPAIVKPFNELRQKLESSLKLQALVNNEWGRVQELAKKPMDSFIHGQYKMIRHLIETSQGLNIDYVDTRYLVEQSEKNTNE